MTACGLGKAVGFVKAVGVWMGDMAEAIGLSLGASRCTGVSLGRPAVTRQSVLTLYRHRAAELGLPLENPAINERGLVITDFVGRVGDPVGLVAADGSVHRGEVLVCDAVASLLSAVGSAGSAGPAGSVGSVVVTHPAHWRPSAVDALRSALGDRLGRLGLGPVTVVSDATAAITALQNDPGVAAGVIALCDFGGTGTSVTLLDASAGYRPIGPSVRHADFSGDLIDQALLKHVIADLSTAGAVDVSGTSALRSLNRLRRQCRTAKERLSGSTVTPLAVDVPGFRGDVRLTRNELDDEIGPALTDFVGVLQDTLDRFAIGDLVAVASVGGGANIPAITTTLSQHFRVPVITVPRADLVAAGGAALLAARGPADERATAMAPAAVAAGAVAGAAVASGFAGGATGGFAGGAVGDAGPQSSMFGALAWSEAPDLPPVAAPVDSQYGDPGAASARPQLRFEGPDVVDGGSTAAAGTAAAQWYRRPTALAGAALLAVLLVATAAMVALRHNPGPASSTTPLAPSSTVPAAVQNPAAVQSPAAVAPGSSADSGAGQQPAGQQPAGQQVGEQPAPQTVVAVPPPATQAVQAPDSGDVAPPPASAPPPSVAPSVVSSTDSSPPVAPSAAPSPPSMDTPAPVTESPTPIQTYRPRFIPPIPPIPTIPGLPPLVPGPGGQ